MRISAPTLATTDRPYYEDSAYPSPSAKALNSLDKPPVPVTASQIAELSTWASSTSDSRSLLDSFHTALTAQHASDMLATQPAAPTTEQLVAAKASTLRDWPVSSFLVLPNSFGTIFLGDTFHAYLCMRNESSHPVRDATLLVEMQTGDGGQAAGRSSGHRVLLAKVTNQDPTAEHLSSSARIETTVKHEIKELGPHVLICTVTYTVPVLEHGQTVWAGRSFRKFYKFAVPASPISVRTKTIGARTPAALLHPDARVRDKVLLEVQVQNVSGSPLVFDSLDLRPAPGWEWSSIDRPQDQQAKHMWRGPHQALLPDDVRQYLFALHPPSQPPVIPPPKPGEAVSVVTDALGHLDISWRLSLGEPGRLQTSALTRRRILPTPVRAGSGPLVEASMHLVQPLVSASASDDILLKLRIDARDLSDDDDRPLSLLGRPNNQTLRLALQHAHPDPGPAYLMVHGRPPPPETAIPDSFRPSPDVHFLGPSLVPVEHGIATLTYRADTPGFKRFGGARLLLLGWDNDGQPESLPQPLVLREWCVLAEAWVQ